MAETVTFSEAKLESGWLMVKVPREFLGTVMGWIRRKKDRSYDLTIREHREKRSLDANAYAWVLIGKLAAAMGLKPLEVYRQAVRDVGDNYTPMCVREKDVERFRKSWESNGLGWPCDDLGPSQVPGCRNLAAYHGSSTYDTAQMSRLIDNLVQDCNANGRITRGRCWKSTGRACPGGGISAPLQRRAFMNKQDWNQSQYYQEDFLASHSVQPGSGEARRMTVTSGRKCCELYRKSGPLGSLEKTWLDLYEWRLMKFFPTLKRRDMKRERIAAKLGMSEDCSAEKESLLWPRPTTGAPLCGGTGNFRQMEKLRDAGIITEEERRNLTCGSGGSSNPALMEWLMGFPLGWTDLNVSETPSCPSSFTPSSRE